MYYTTLLWIFKHWTGSFFTYAARNEPTCIVERRPKMDIQGIEPWTSRMRSVRATTVPNAPYTINFLDKLKIAQAQSGRDTNQCSIFNERWDWHCDRYSDQYCN